MIIEVKELSCSFHKGQRARLLKYLNNKLLLWVARVGHLSSFKNLILKPFFRLSKDFLNYAINSKITYQGQRLLRDLTFSIEMQKLFEYCLVT